MKKVLSIFFFTVLFSPLLSTQDFYTDDFKDFTFEMPDGWETLDYTGLKYKIIYGDSVDNYNQNMIFIRQEDSGTIDEVIVKYIDEVKNINPEYEILKTENFENNFKIEAKKMITEIFQGDIKIKQYFYLFKKNNFLFICIASLTPNKDIEIAMEEILDNSMKTFQILDKEE